MIVISGALVLVALVLLVIGVVGPDLTFVYASIGVSLVSLVFLVIGILQRRGEAPATEAAAVPAPDVTEEPVDSVTTVLPAQGGRSSRRAVEDAPVAASAADEPPAAGRVLVVEGRPRYHVAGCRYLTGKDAEAVDVDEARDEGFSPCGVCKPDEALAAAPQVEEAAQEPVVEEDVPGVDVPAPARTATRAVRTPAKKSVATKAATKAAVKAPAKAPEKAPTKAAAKAPTKAPAAKAPAAKAPAAKAATRAPAAKAVTKAPAATAPVKVAAPAKAAPAATSAAAKKAPSRAATAAAAATPAAASAAKRAGSVVVIPDRGKFHRAECRFVRGVDEAEVLSKSAATRQGYVACGVCKP